MDFWFRLPLRTRLGWIALVLVGIALVSMLQASRDPLHHKPLYAVIKWAPIVLLFWLAWADLSNIPLWVWLVAPPVLILCALKPAAWFVVIPVALFALFTMPKKRRKKK